MTEDNIKFWNNIFVARMGYEGAYSFIHCIINPLRAEYELTRTLCMT